MAHKYWNTFFWFITIVALIFGFLGLLGRLRFGHQSANYGSYVPWGLWVAGYIYLIGLSAGAFFMSALVYIFRIEALEKIGKFSLLTALSTLVGAMLCIWLDLGHMTRAWRLILTTNFGSVMGWMAWLYSGYFGLILLEFWFATRADMIVLGRTNRLKGKFFRFLTFGKEGDIEAIGKKDKKVLRILSFLAIPLAITFHGAVGALFGVVETREHWNSGITPILFLVGAATSGCALLTFLTSIWGPEPTSESHQNLMTLLGKILLGLLLCDILLEWSEYSIHYWNSIASENSGISLILFGRYWWVFWFVHVGLGVLIPLFLLVFCSKNKVCVGFAGALISFTFISVRLNIVIPGLAVEELHGLVKAYHGPGLNFEYFPSLLEWQVFIFSIAISAFIFLLGNAILPITEKKFSLKEA